MNHEQIYDFLGRTGHLQYPKGVEQSVPTGPFSQAIKTAQGLKAVASFQEFEAELLDKYSLKYHNRSAMIDGEIGPATLKAMEAPRCGHPDYGPNVQPATGSGSWKSCHNIGDFHSALVRINDSGMPSFLTPIFKDVWDRVSASYADIGLAFTLTDNTPNTEVSFVSRSNGWIGLAIVGQQESCSSQIWAKFLATYKPNNVLNEWTTLIMHELGHNAGLQHSRGGVMNPSIVQGLAPTWRGDPSEPVLVNYYGGVPITPDIPEGDEFWTFMGYKSNKGNVEWVPLPVPFKRE